MSTISLLRKTCKRVHTQKNKRILKILFLTDSFFKLNPHMNITNYFDFDNAISKNNNSFSFFFFLQAIANTLLATFQNLQRVPGITEMRKNKIK